MKKSAATLIFLFTQLVVFGQNKLLKDVDHDGITDTVYVDSAKHTIVCKLSSKNYHPISSKPIGILNVMSGVVKTKNGFEFFNDWMRAGYKNQFRYNPKTKKIQLIGMSKYEFGNAVSDGSGESGVNLLTADYIGNWNYFDTDKDKVIKIPTIRAKMKFGLINLEDFEEETYFGYSKRCAELFYKHRKIKMNKK